MGQGKAYELWGEIFGCCRMDSFWTVLQAVVAVDVTTGQFVCTAR